jgi:SAM-dependent methyltransferase
MHCNLCGAEVSPEQPAVWRKNGYDIIRCRRCGLVFRRELPTVDELTGIYREGYFRNEPGGDAEGYADYLSDEPEHRLTARRRLGRIERTMRPGRLLDVGCAAGFFVDEAVKRGWTARGIDVAPYMSNWGRDRLHVELETGLFQEARFGDSTFDCVTMWDYIEHSVDPGADFESAARVLRPGGRLLLSTGDISSVAARLSGRRWHLLTPHHHNFFFTSRTLRTYLNRSGFEVVSVSRPAAVYSLRYIAYKLGTMAPRSRAVRALAGWMDRRALGERAVPLNLFDIVTVEARIPAGLGAAR